MEKILCNWAKTSFFWTTSSDPLLIFGTMPLIMLRTLSASLSETLRTSWNGMLGHRRRPLEITCLGILLALVKIISDSWNSTKDALMDRVNLIQRISASHLPPLL